jgi:PAS domain-containing protein
MITAKIEYMDYSRSSVVNNTLLCHSEEETAVLTLNNNGTIRECNQAAAELLDCAPTSLTWQHISTIMPQLAEATLMQGERINPNIRFLSHIGYGFEVIGLSGVHFACALFFNEVENFGHQCLRLIIRPIAQDLAIT